MCGFATRPRQQILGSLGRARVSGLTCFSYNMSWSGAVNRQPCFRAERLVELSSRFSFSILNAFRFSALLRASWTHHQMRHQHMSPFWGHDLSTFRASLQTMTRTWSAHRGRRLLALMGSRCRAARLQSGSGSTLVRARSRCGECKHWMYKRARVCAHGRERA